MTALAVKGQMDFQDGNGHSIAPPESFNPMILVQRAIEKDVDPTTLERLTAVGERWLETQARQKFAEALAGFQREMKPVHKGRKADRFTYAGFDDIMGQAAPLLAKYGISIGFDSAQADKAITVSCRIRVGSYHEDRTFTVPVPASLKVSEPQQFGAALSYAKRYCLCAALNIVVTNEDNEGALASSAPITPDQMKEINELVKAMAERTKKPVDEVLARFLKWAKVDSVSEMTQGTYKAAVPMLNGSRAAI